MDVNIFSFTFIFSLISSLKRFVLFTVVSPYIQMYNISQTQHNTPPFFFTRRFPTILLACRYRDDRYYRLDLVYWFAIHLVPLTCSSLEYRCSSSSSLPSVFYLLFLVGIFVENRRSSLIIYNSSPPTQGVLKSCLTCSLSLFLYPSHPS